MVFRTNLDAQSIQNKYDLLNTLDYDTMLDIPEATIV